MSSSLSLLVGFSIQDEAVDVARSAPQGAHYHADVIYLLAKMGIKKGASALWYSQLSIHQLGSRPTVFIPRWTTRPRILYQVCVTRGATRSVGPALGFNFSPNRCIISATDYLFFILLFMLFPDYLYSFDPGTIYRDLCTHGFR